MTLLARALLLLALASWAYWLLALVAVRRHFRGAAPPLPVPPPPVSLLKPVRGVDADARECHESFFRLDYPQYEIVFAVADPADPVLPLLAELRAAHPEVPSRVVVAPAPGPNRKACLLEAIAKVARHGVLVATDSDMRVAPSWLRDVVAALSAPGVGLVTCPYRGAAPRSLAARLEALHMGVTFLPSTVVASDRLGMPFAMGSTMALRRSDLDAIGGFGPLADYLADDYQLGARVAALGRRVVLSSHIVDSVLGRTAFRDGWDREVRWGRCTRASQPAGHVGYAVTFSTPLALLALLATGFAPVGWGALAGSLAVRWGVAAGVARATRDRAALRALPLLPLRDALTAAVWVAALTGRQVRWRGEAFDVDRSGRLRPSARRTPAAGPGAR
ncbi:bacteriohopanetetrol glucosamine biosynthesis glycosyltransferase HpnI [Anaeromyxobacter oryzisoli]|uniref:bacteriohopanetetrol glucosamine biosynthesis glycosyltransferase HpnI n=1 Tax=Anaeromyxobacter oryzisoli TaxID=2925408 RepID=UPI001F5AE2E9|nr:bacteriohopanetetrol glucosamine biosynthesis glycosyltransferase HpnI [Anaeromyxobacter sp. SG63]